MIGSRTVTSLALVGLVAAVAAHTGLLSPERMLALDGRTVFAVGCFAVVVGTLLVRFWRAHERSRYYLRFARSRGATADEAHFVGGDRRHVVLGENRGEALDLGPRLQHLAWISVALLTALATLSPRAIDQLLSLPSRMELGRSGYCPDEEAAQPAGPDPNEPGCALIRRAYELGYAKDLGECGKNEKKTSAAGPCTRRQRDEPFLHYAWRRLTESWTTLRATATGTTLAAARADFEQRAAGLETLYETQRELVASTPRASHHVFTNLPEPESPVVGTRTCLERTRLLPQRAPAGGGSPTAASVLFEHVVSQLLFEARYEPAAGSCRELQIHWGAPADACELLARDPEALLARTGGDEALAAALERRRVAVARRELDARTGRLNPKERPIPDASRIVSFACWVEEPRADVARRTVPVRIDGLELEAREVRAPPPSPTELNTVRYGLIAGLLARGFHYGALLSDAGVDVAGAGESVARSLQAPDFPLTRLYALAAVDVYVAPEAVAGREDLLEVYPYHQHLRNFVHLFRQAYAREHARL